MDVNLVSIIIPIYNVSKYLDRCIESVCDQTYKNLEIILVDDGSTDNCPKKCDNWAKKDKRIIVIHKTNGGLSDARNAGLDVATGKYVYFLDGDDSIETNLIETVVKYMDNGFDMVSFRYNKIFSDKSKKLASYNVGSYFLDNAESKVSFLINELLRCQIGWEAWSRIFSHSIIKKYHLRFADNNKIFAEDLHFSIIYCIHAERIRSIPNALYNYYVRDNSIMQNNRNKLNIEKFCSLCESVYSHILECDEYKMLIDYFPVIFFMIMDRPLMNALQFFHYNYDECRDYIYNDINNDFFVTHFRRLSSFKRELSYLFSGSQLEEKLSFIKYLVDGNYLLFCLRNKTIYMFSDFFDRNSYSMRKLKKQYRKISLQKKRIFYIGCEDFGNIGDYQINEATVYFLSNALPGYNVFEVSMREFNRNVPFLKKYIRKNDILISNGGGNFGSYYTSSMRVREEMIKLWPNNNKIIFPQTIFFSEDSQGKSELSRAKKLYTKENNITLFTRDKTSYQFAKNNFSCKCVLVPDIVLSTEIAGKQMVREYSAIMCFREDGEKVIEEGLKRNLSEICQSLKMNIIFTDLQLDNNNSRKNQKSIVEQKIEMWSRASIVLTDRLHGMIFSAITGTPCVAFSNYNHKIKEAYEWIKYLPYIKYAENITQAREYIDELVNMKESNYDITPLLPYFDKISEILRECS